VPFKFKHGCCGLCKPSIAGTGRDLTARDLAVMNHKLRIVTVCGMEWGLEDAQIQRSRLLTDIYNELTLTGSECDLTLPFNAGHFSTWVFSDQLSICDAIRTLEVRAFERAFAPRNASEGLDQAEKGANYLRLRTFSATCSCQSG
jgi:hypothetical protein